MTVQTCGIKWDYKTPEDFLPNPEITSLPTLKDRQQVCSAVNTVSLPCLDATLLPPPTAHSPRIAPKMGRKPSRRLHKLRALTRQVAFLIATNRQLKEENDDLKRSLNKMVLVNEALRFKIERQIPSNDEEEEVCMVDGAAFAKLEIKEPASSNEGEEGMTCLLDETNVEKLRMEGLTHSCGGEEVESMWDGVNLEELGEQLTPPSEGDTVTYMWHEGEPPKDIFASDLT